MWNLYPVYSKKHYLLLRRFNSRTSLTTHMLVRSQVCDMWVLRLHFLTCFNLNPALTSNYIHYNVWDEITYPFLNFQRCKRWSLGVDKYFHPTLYWVYDYLYMLGLKLNHVNKRCHWYEVIFTWPPAPMSMPWFLQPTLKQHFPIS